MHEVSDPPPGAALPPAGIWQFSWGVFGCHVSMGGCYWVLLGSSQGADKPPPYFQGTAPSPHPLTENFSAPNANSGEVETPLHATLLAGLGGDARIAALVLQKRVCRGDLPLAPGLSESRPRPGPLFCLCLASGQRCSGGMWGGGER